MSTTAKREIEMKSCGQVVTSRAIPKGSPNYMASLVCTEHADALKAEGYLVETLPNPSLTYLKCYMPVVAR